MVRVRGVGRSHPSRQQQAVTVETVYRPLADPSLPERELDRQVPRDHPVGVKVRAALQELVKRYGGPPPPPSAEPAGGPGGGRQAEEPPTDEGDATPGAT